jgi:5'-nucleotidase
MKGGCDYIVVLSQMGVDGDREIAEKWTEIDLIVGGHSQTLIEKPVMSGKTRIVQAGKGGGRVGEIVLRFGELNKMESFTYKLFEVSDRYTILPEIQTLLDDAVQAQEP